MSRAYYVAEVDFNGDPEVLDAVCGGGCGWKGKASQLADIEDCSLTPGDPSPAGRCPACDALAYVEAA